MGSRRAGLCVLLAAAVAVTGGIVGTTEPSAAAPGDTTTTSTAAPTTTTTATTAAAPLPIEQSALALSPARRLRQIGSLPFPMAPTLPGNPKSRCLVLNNFGDSRGTRTGLPSTAVCRVPHHARMWQTPGMTHVPRMTLGVLAFAVCLAAGCTPADNAAAGAKSFFNEVGDKVTLGQLIGYVGDTGNANDSGPNNYHLHFEVHPGGQAKAAVDPVPMLEIPRACTLYAK
ncbi:MAG: M23 family metallopeptidase [Actinobacteria bacterium]|nr:M23 family metallopeptidase [Actinomycetota bacterium]